MKHKKFTALIICIAVCLSLGIGSVSASDSEDAFLAASESGDYSSQILDNFDLAVVDTLWDVDFESNSLSNGTDGDVCDSSGEALKNNKGDIFQIHKGGANSSFEISQYSGASKDNGKSLKASIKGYDEVKFNEFQSTANSNYIIFNYDYSSENLASDEYIGYVRFYTESGTTVDSPQIRLGGNGNLWIPHGVKVFKQLSTVQAKEWMNVGIVYDFDTSMYYIYIDGTLAYSADLSSYNIAKTYKLIVSTKGGFTAYSGEYWVDNIKVVEAKSKNSIVSVTNDEKSFDITFKNPINVPTTEDFEIKFGKNILSIADMEQISENVIRVTTNQEIFTGVYIDISLKDNDLDEFMTYTHLTETNPFDLSEVSVESVDGVVSAKAKVINSTGESRKVTMVMALKDENGDVIALAFTPAAEYEVDTEISVSSDIGDAQTAEVFFVDDFDNCRPVKNIKYEMAIE